MYHALRQVNGVLDTFRLAGMPTSRAGEPFALWACVIIALPGLALARVRAGSLLALEGTREPAGP